MNVEREFMQLTLNKDEEEVVYSLAERLTGSHQGGRFRKTVLVQNVLRRMQNRGLQSLHSYLQLVAEDRDEFSHFVSALTIHFTNFFRESSQFEPFLALLLEGREEKPSPVRILVAACSTGEEAFSIALFLEKQRLAGRISDYKIEAFDIDPKSVSKAQKGIYPANCISDIPLSYRSFLLQGSGKTQGYFTFSKELRSQIHWFAADMRKISDIIRARSEALFDGILCRNVLIYFDEKGINGVLKQFLEVLTPSGVLGLGHSETIQVGQYPLVAKGRSLYVSKPKSAITASQQLKALVIDDSLTVRKVLATILLKAGFVVETVDSAQNASKFLSDHQVDLITLDLNMPVVDGASWLRQQRGVGLKTPVVIISDAHPDEAEKVLGALLGGAQDYIFKQELSRTQIQVGERLKLITEQYIQKIPEKSISQTTHKESKITRFHPELIVIGSSTGGTEALVSLLGLMPLDSPPIMVVQHITQSFAKPFFQRLARISGLKQGVIEQDAPVLPGHLYMALDDYHLGLKKVGEKLKVNLSYAPAEHAVRPAADVLFRSVARAKVAAMGLILTGMGKDGALGMLEMKHSGCYTLAQDENSCVVFGMPREAIRMNAVHYVGHVRNLREEIDQCLSLPRYEAKSA